MSPFKTDLKQQQHFNLDSTGPEALQPTLARLHLLRLCNLGHACTSKADLVHYTDAWCHHCDVSLPVLHQTMLLMAAA